MTLMQINAPRANRDPPRSPLQPSEDRLDHIDSSARATSAPAATSEIRYREMFCAGTVPRWTYAEGRNSPTTGSDMLAPSARGGARTRTTSRSGGFKPPASACYATRACGPTLGDATSPSTAAHRAPRRRSASGPSNRLAATTPSIMSASTAAQGRPRTRTATCAPWSNRRSERSAPHSLGGLRNPGASSRRERASRARTRAADAKRRVVAGSTRTMMPEGCDRDPGRPGSGQPASRPGR